MKVAIERLALLRTLGHMASVIEKRNTQPILANVLLETEGDNIIFRSTDLDITIVESVQASSILEPGATTVSAHLFHDVVRKLPEGAQIRLEQQGDEPLTLSSGAACFTLQTLSSDDFPPVGQKEGGSLLTLEAKLLHLLIVKTQFAISVDDARYYLNGIYFHGVSEAGENFLRAAATDGHRLACATIPFRHASEALDQGIIVPRKTVIQMEKLLSGFDADVEFRVRDNQISLAAGNVVLTSKLVDGSFPEYDKVIPKDNEKILDVNRQAFARSVDLVSTVSNDRGRAVKLSLEKDHLTASVNNPDAGQGVETLEVSYADAPFEIAFNARYLYDVCTQIEAETLRVKLKESDSPILIEGDPDISARYVLMPMRL